MLMSRRAAIFIGVGCAVLCLTALASTWVGAASLVHQPTLAQTWHALRLNDPSDELSAIVHSRLPRTVNAVLVGAGLAAAGAAMQGLTRNPLAEPGYVGISSGAAMAVVVGMAAGVGGSGSTLPIAALAIVGAFVTSTVVYVLAGKGARQGQAAAAMRLILVGAAVMAMTNSVIQAVMLSNQNTLEQYRVWQVGGISRSTVHDALLICPLLMAGILLVVGNMRALNAFAMGEDMAQGLGMNVPWRRAQLIAAVTLCAGASVALTGPIGFVGLIVPHMVRAVVGQDYTNVVPCCLVAGPVVVLAADIVGRVILPPGEVPVGVLMAVAGTPFFLWLLRGVRHAA